ncbi:MAG: YbjN domain-containing protein [Clostridia bacterium]|nr:YbjN domain-containing protein [Clostridia bacterium]
MTLSDDGLLGHVEVRIIIKEDGFQVQALSPINVPSDKRDEMAIFLTYINYQFRSGNFEMDYRDGEVAFKMDQFCGDQMPGPDVIERAIYVPIAMFDKYAQSMVSIMMGMQSGKSAAENLKDDD